jgi:hypothetical protein
MKSKMKVLAAAVAMAFAGPGFAATATPVSGNSELIFNVWDTVAEASFSMDLAPLASASQMGSFYLNDFLPTGATAGGLPTPGTYTIAPGGVEASNIDWNWSIVGDAWSTFLTTVAGAGSSSSNWLWNVYAGDSTGANGQLDQKRIITTSLADFATMSAVTPSNIGYVNNTDPLFAGISLSNLLVDDNSITHVNGDALYFGTGNGVYMNGSTPASSMAAVGEAMNFYYLAGTGVGARANSAGAIQFANGAQWLFDGTTLNYSTNGETVVPLPPAVWLLGSALVGLAGVARRREPAAA